MGFERTEKPVSGGGVSAGAWEIAFTRRALATDPNDGALVPSGVSYDVSFQYAAAAFTGAAGTLPAITAPTVEVTPGFFWPGPAGAAIAGSMRFTPDGVTPFSVSLSPGRMGYVEAFSDVPSQNIDLTSPGVQCALMTTGQFGTRWRLSGGADAYFVVARRRVIIP